VNDRQGTATPPFGLGKQGGGRWNAELFQGFARRPCVHSATADGSVMTRRGQSVSAEAKTVRLAGKARGAGWFQRLFDRQGVEARCVEAAESG